MDALRPEGAPAKNRSLNIQIMREFSIFLNEVEPRIRLVAQDLIWCLQQDTCPRSATD
jgi:hypothetical protein